MLGYTTRNGWCTYSEVNTSNRYTIRRNTSQIAGETSISAASTGYAWTGTRLGTDGPLTRSVRFGTKR